ncbi:MAG: murein hydrolase activator EnvC family protein [Culicoidibacterales bacterium]
MRTSYKQIVICIFCLLSAVFSSFATPSVVYACTSVEDCQTEISNATEERKKLQSQIADTKSQTDALVAEVQNLQVQVATYNAQIEAAKQTIVLLDTQSKQLQETMKATEKIMSNRLVTMQLMYETNQNINFIADSSSITDMIERTQAVNELTDNDQKLVKTYDAQHKQVLENKFQTEKTKNELESFKVSQEKLIQENTAKIEEFKASQQKLEQEEHNVKEDQVLSEQEMQKIKNELNRIPVTPIRPEVTKPSNQGNAQQNNQNSSTPSNNNQPNVPTKPNSGVVYPLNHAILTAAYGESSWHTIPHNGTDYAPRGNTTLYSMVDGVVVASKYNRARGWLVAIAFDDGRGLKTLLYQHMSGQSNVGIGERVSKGQVVGNAGNTGMSFGVHLHVEVGDAGSGGKWIDRGASSGPGLYPTESYFGLPYSW